MLALTPFEPSDADKTEFAFEVEAADLGRYVIEISLPRGWRASGDRLPVILTTDGNILFDVVQVAAHGRMHQWSDVIPRSIVVGVGYPADEGLTSWTARRNFDFHGPWDMTDPIGQMLLKAFEIGKAAEGRPHLQMGAGGYDRFMAFLRDELLPALAAEFPIDLDGRHTLIGHSSGGHFVMRALFDPASPFRRYICSSPGFKSANGAIERAEAEYAARHDDLDAEIYVCCGQEELAVHGSYMGHSPTAIRFGGGVVWLAEQCAIRQWKSARVDWEILNNEAHGGVMRAISAGLLSVHGVRPGMRAPTAAPWEGDGSETIKSLSQR